MDIIYISDLKISTIIGVNDWERHTKQTLRLDVELGTDISLAAASDHIDQTLNYQAIAERLTQFINDSNVMLIETLADRVAHLLQNEFAVTWLRLTVAKPGILPNAREVGVTIERHLKRDEVPMNDKLATQ